MRQKIEIDITENELDFFLKARYGYSIWEFKLSLLQTNIIYFYGKGRKMENIANERIIQLRDLKEKILILLDDFLSNLNFYKNSARLKSIKDITGVSDWTVKNKKKFIVKKYNLDYLFTIIDRQIEYYQALDFKLEFERTLWGVESLVRIKPINFLILIWSYAMKIGGRIDWINMERLLSWFSRNVYEKELIDFFNFSREVAYPSEVLRLTRNKYSGSKYDKLAQYIFQNYFKNVKYEIKKDYPKIVSNLKKLYLGKKDATIEEMQEFNDLFACLSALYPDHFNSQK